MANARVWEVHGVAGLRTGSSISDGSQGVTLTDGPGIVTMELARGSYGAQLTPDQARHVANALLAAAARAEAWGQEAWGRADQVRRSAADAVSDGPGDTSDDAVPPASAQGG